MTEPTLTHRKNYTDLLEGAMRADNAWDFRASFPPSCLGCSLSDHPGNVPVLYRGDENAKIALIGEAPGKEERKQMRPFVGPAGELLDKIFAAIGIPTENLFITNVVWCRPVAAYGSGRENYTPKAEQIKTCWPYTEKLVDLVKPDIVIACGLPALKIITGKSSIRMGDYEGKWLHDVHPDRAVFVMKHPAALLHLARDPKAQHEAKAKVWAYMQTFRDTYKEYLRQEAA
jgi:DNA polymerase